MSIENELCGWISAIIPGSMSTIENHPENRAYAVHTHFTDRSGAETFVIYDSDSSQCSGCRVLGRSPVLAGPDVRARCGGHSATSAHPLLTCSPERVVVSFGEEYITPCGLCPANLFWRVTRHYRFLDIPPEIVRLPVI